jgi:uncharacterized protein (DUF433 family)
MEEALDASINTRVPRRVKQALEEVAKDRRVNPLTFARTLIDEGLRRERHPGIVFREGPAGRRASIEGRRLDVWQVMETVWASGGDVDDAGEYLGLRPDQVRAAVRYYTDYPVEIDEWVQRNREEADRVRAQWEREQASLRK